MGFATTIGAFALLMASSHADDTPNPLVIPASQYFEGNDGPWSTFDIRVGTPEQYMRVLVSTAAPYSLVALADVACSTDVFETVPSDCAVSRGNLFSLNKSSSWLDLGIYGINGNGVGLEANLGYEQRVQFGLDHVGIGLNGPGLENQTVGGIATPSPFYLGILGLNNQPLNFSTLSNSSSSTFITTLKDQNKIPSLSWSYTAGAQYREKQVYGQLIFSGYDTSRFEENPVSFTMADDITRDLVVALQSISYSGSQSATLLSNPVNVYIDSTDPNLWLPGDVCDAFEEVFGLELDEQSGLYLVNDTHHNSLLDSDAQVTFRLSDVESGGDAVTVVLPYAAFDLTAKAPLVENSTYYFPLKRAANATQYTLGRTFLQEAYLSADYERKVFNVSACVWNEGATENIVTITSTDSGSDPGSTGASSSSNGLSKGAIAGIAVACAVVGLLLIGALAFLILRKRRKWINQGFKGAKPETTPDMAVLQGPVFNSTSESTSEGTPQSGNPLIFAPTRSTAEYTRNGSAADGSTPARSVATGDNIGGGSTVELDGRDTLVRPNTEIDGREIHPIAENPGVYELPGTDVAEGSHRHDGQLAPSPPSAVDTSPSNDGRNSGNHSPPSPFTSTMDSNWGERLDQEMVSPTTPRHSGARQF